MSDINQEMLECLEWYVQEDDTRDIPNNGHWIAGYERARQVVAKAKGEDYAPLEWENWTPEEEPK